jgi:hypothetical protein
MRADTVSASQIACGAVAVLAYASSSLVPSKVHGAVARRSGSRFGCRLTATARFSVVGFASRRFDFAGISGLVAILTARRQTILRAVFWREHGDWDDFLLSRNSARFGAELPRREVPNLGCERAARMPSAGITLTCNFWSAQSNGARLRAPHFFTKGGNHGHEV